MNKIRERGETSLLSGADGPLSRCDEFQTPCLTHHKGTHHET